MSQLRPERREPIVRDQPELADPIPHHLPADAVPIAKGTKQPDGLVVVSLARNLVNLGSCAEILSGDEDGPGETIAPRFEGSAREPRTETPRVADAAIVREHEVAKLVEESEDSRVDPVALVHEDDRGSAICGRERQTLKLGVRQAVLKDQDTQPAERQTPCGEGRVGALPGKLLVDADAKSCAYLGRGLVPGPYRGQGRWRQNRQLAEQSLELPRPTELTSSDAAQSIVAASRRPEVRGRLRNVGSSGQQQHVYRNAVLVSETLKLAVCRLRPARLPLTNRVFGLTCPFRRIGKARQRRLARPNEDVGGNRDLFAHHSGSLATTR
jgi:hypothetical protein